jgi:O-antigen ligase
VKAASAQAIGLLLAGGLCLLPFLVPYHQQPVLSFFPEWLAAALGVAAALALLLVRGIPAASFPAPARWLIAFALVLVVQAAIGRQAYSQLPLLAALYVLYAALMIWLGANLAAALGIERVASVLAAFLVAGALANSMAGVIQFQGRSPLFEDIVAELHGNRAYGNIAQSNLYANYLALGESALLFLWLRARVRTVVALPALALLLLGSALSGSRSTFLYALWYAALGLIAARLHDATISRRLRLAAFGVAVAALATQLAIPWLIDELRHSPRGAGLLDRMLASPVEHAEPRLQASLIALRVFAGAPLTGVGTGEFAGAAFESGLDPSLARSGEVWTSPHNLPLHLLAETGLLGAVLALGGLLAWGWQAARRYRIDPEVASWWIIAAVGIELIHSMVEFPLWSAHFLGVTALLIGAGAQPGPRSASRTGWIAPGAACAVLAVTLGIALRDYVRLDTTRISGTALTLTSAAQVERDAATMRGLTHGLMGPLAELWIVIGAPLDRDHLADKLAMSGRVVRFWPANAVVVRRAVFLALDDRVEEARGLLAQALKTFPHRLDATILILREAHTADPDAIEPLLAMARADRFRSEK